MTLQESHILIRAWSDSIGFCAYCGKPILDPYDFSVEHVTPRSRGGTNRLHNLVVACRPCNFSRGDKSLDEYRQDAGPFWIETAGIATLGDDNVSWLEANFEGLRATLYIYIHPWPWGID